jgi:hypothetical protein
MFFDADMTHTSGNAHTQPHASSLGTKRLATYACKTRQVHAVTSGKLLLLPLLLPAAVRVHHGQHEPAGGCCTSAAPLHAVPALRNPRQADC